MYLYIMKTTILKHADIAKISAALDNDSMDVIECEVLSAKSFLEYYKKSSENIMRAQYIRSDKPLGSGDFGKFAITYKNPILRHG